MLFYMLVERSNAKKKRIFVVVIFVVLRCALRVVAVGILFWLWGYIIVFILLLILCYCLFCLVLAGWSGVVTITVSKMDMNKHVKLPVK